MTVDLSRLKINHALNGLLYTVERIIMVSKYFNRLIKYFESTFDFTRPFTWNGHTYDALACFHAHVDKYVLVKKAQLWACDSHEYCIINTYEESFTVEDFDQLTTVLTDYLEPHYVRNDGSDPEKDHMYSYLTLIMVCGCPLTKDVIRKVKGYRFTKYYKMYTRGYSEAHVILVDTLNSKVYTNAAGKSKLKLCKNVFKDLKAGKE